MQTAQRSGASPPAEGCPRSAGDQTWPGRQEVAMTKWCHLGKTSQISEPDASAPELKKQLVLLV